jgi:hypothetical protein
MGSALAKLTNGLNVAIIQIGSTLRSTSPPTRIAEEYPLIDYLSGGRLVAGFPTGLPMRRSRIGSSRSSSASATARRCNSC